MTAAAIAEEILSSPRIKLATVHVSGVADEANAHQNMEDTAAGHAAHRSSYGTAPGGTVALEFEYAAWHCSACPSATASPYRSCAAARIIPTQDITQVSPST